MSDLAQFLSPLRYGHKLALKNLQGAGLMTFGNIFFVNSVTGSDTANTGQDEVQPLATLGATVGKCTANNGDVIIMLPGHTEAVTSTSTTLDVAGVTIIGLGSGSMKPTLTFAATNSRINVTAANCTLQNLRLKAAVGDVVTAVLHATAAQNTRYLDIEFFATSTFNFINGYTLGAANISDGCRWERNYLRTADAGQLALTITAAAHNDLKYYDNYVVHAATAAGLLTAGAADLLGLDVVRNHVQTGQTDGTVGVLVITTSTASSGRIVENHMKTADASANVAIPIASKVYAANNYVAGTDEVGTIIAVGTLFDNT